MLFRSKQDWYGRFPELRDKYVLTLAGRLTRLKGHEAFLRLMAHLSDEDEGMHGLIVGDADPSGRAYAQSLRREVASRALPVTFSGHRQDMREIYASSDLVLSLSSHPESFGRTVLEVPGRSRSPEEIAELWSYLESLLFRDAVHDISRPGAAAPEQASLLKVAGA